VAVTLYLARHAEASNPRGILYGRLPRVDLSDNGRVQAAELAGAMADLPLAAIYHSPLLRARRTAAAIASRHPGVRLIRSSLLLENLHPFQGRPQSEVATLGDRVYDPDVIGQGGESIEDLRDRLGRFLRLVARRHAGAAVAAVAHADPIAALRLHLLGKELNIVGLRQEAPPPAAVFRIDLLDASTTQLSWFWRPAAPPSTPRETPAAQEAVRPVAVAESDPASGTDRAPDCPAAAAQVRSSG
jgi:broad specificity phosphatase PhoE